MKHLQLSARNFTFISSSLFPPLRFFFIRVPLPSLFSPSQHQMQWGTFSSRSGTLAKWYNLIHPRCKTSDDWNRLKLTIKRTRVWGKSNGARTRSLKKGWEGEEEQRRNSSRVRLALSCWAMSITIPKDTMRKRAATSSLDWGLDWRLVLDRTG
ncbi:hypothetical protein MPTK1_1g12780 [Marchantia polymorpha subsp. ruderalis]|uniref:Uncharacterized protein n=2 Tax=Marchantia polymorpha TaxID=3197 RepID=A0AAF6APH5_MARPO|nr:hypothetical protein MARPO_0019s0048 [Marchantia polymorpha]BBM98345.1 hypothetical protein Mp_1g12780 [Marchantia polymorpha subsp. ruderalis]|eukprot:PTQ44612.1 hypothetical protein MARPO_0019s0048 [Marchantia polymorpha]